MHMLQFRCLGGNRVMRIIAASCLLLSITVGSALATDLGSVDQKSLAAIEKKYFGHSFDTDSDESRAVRLESLIFGDRCEGAPVNRLKKLIAVAVNEEDGCPTQQPPQSQTGDNTGRAGKTSPSPTSTSSSNSRTVTAENSCPEADPGVEINDYPHISALEKTILGSIYAKDALPHRLARLESKAFGAVSHSPDLSERTEKLQQYAETHLHAKPIATAPDSDVEYFQSYANEVPAGSGPPSQPGEYPHINALEQAILGNTYPGDLVAERLGRLETKAFGAVSNSADLSQRTDKLQEYAEVNLHAKQFLSESHSETEYADSTSEAGAASGAGNYPHVTALEKNILGQTFNGQPLTARLSRLETTAFGQPSSDADLSRRTDALESFSQKKLHKKSFQPPPNSATTASSPGAGMSKQLLAMAANTVLNATGLGAVGMLAGAGMGMNALQARQQQENTAAVQQPDEDPAVYANVPPPDGARMITRVGWCEAQLFGCTFTSMHLKERLRQLSAELHYSTDKTDLQLMDDVGGLVKAVQLRQPRNIPIGSRPGNAASQ